MLGDADHGTGETHLRVCRVKRSYIWIGVSVYKAGTPPWALNTFIHVAMRTPLVKLTSIWTGASDCAAGAGPQGIEYLHMRASVCVWGGMGQYVCAWGSMGQHACAWGSVG